MNSHVVHRCSMLSNKNLDDVVLDIHFGVEANLWTNRDLDVVATTV